MTKEEIQALANQKFMQIGSTECQIRVLTTQREALIADVAQLELEFKKLMDAEAVASQADATGVA